ncbi:hypothetical protein KI688_006248 [Linnemannia hyalina]|uniref:Uncharacterized protein n=1 Tax=Linnemannia hyalina TaxID=64524 RepID=A0A9P8BY82_9FUNG|nr:hypothetical protein KI688_006248 [Linnemannia hyalina]
MFGALLVVLGFIIIPTSKDESTISDRRFDYLGIFSFWVGIVCVILDLTVSPAMVYFSSMLFQNVHGYTPFRTSLNYTVHGLGGVFANILFTKVLTKVKSKIAMVNE